MTGNRFRRKVRTDDIGSVNRLFSYTVIFILFMSLIGISGLTKNYVGSVLVSQLGLLVPLVMYILLNLGRVKEVLGIGKVNAASLAASLVLGLTITPFLGIVNNISSLLVKNVTSERAVEAAEKYPFVVMLAAVAIIPAIIEELMFRGAIFSAYKRKNVVKGAIAAAVLFGLMHGNLNQFAYALVAGFLFAMTDNAGGSVFYSVIAHCVFNTTTLIGIYNHTFKSKLQGILFFDKSYNGVAEVLKDMLIPALIGIVLSAVMYMIIRVSSKAYTDRLENEERLSQNNRMYSNLKIVDASLMVGVIILAVNIIANECM
ncbi:MAG: type II CAAX endopeptidase family protein [Clostridiales bacterium]|nr:type II CAAX endopeptidase family protein [Clostridiales bacterium]